MQQLLSACQLFLFLATDVENSLRPIPKDNDPCHHTARRLPCDAIGSSAFSAGNECHKASDLKYKMVRVTIDAIDLSFVEIDTALNIKVFPVRVAVCNLHGACIRQGVSVLLGQLQCCQVISTGGDRTSILSSDGDWAEVGRVSAGPISFDAAMSGTCQPEHDLRGMLWHKTIPFLSILIL